jgi:RNA polymerase sigma factor (sigma-70 family)
MTPDSELLSKYAEAGSEEAFAELVRRYAALVYSSALRQTTASGLAEEVTQAVFLLLSRKAKSLDSKVIVAGWLLRTTRFIAARARISEQRRHLREKEAMKMHELNHPDEAWTKLAPLLDEGLDRLNEADRNLLIMRFMEGTDPATTCGMLGLSREAAKKRQSRALQKLRKFFARRGFGTSAGLLAAMLGGKFVEAAPHALEAKILGGMSVAGANASLLHLVQQAARDLWWRKLKLSLATATMIFLAVAVVWKAKDQMSSTASGPKENLATLAGAPTPGRDSSFVNRKNANKSAAFQIQVLDSAGAPIPEVKVRSLLWHDWEQEEPPMLRTDQNGLVKVSLAENTVLGRIDIGFLKEGYQEKFLTWRTDKHGPIPTSYIMRLDPAVRIGGMVRDESGVPVPNAEIYIQFAGTGDSAARESKQERLGFVEDWTVATTDGLGQWNCAVVPNDREAFSIFVRHPDFLLGSVERNENLFQGRSQTVMKKGFSANGVVLDESEKPIPAVHLEKPRAKPPVAVVSDSKGRFTINHLETGDNTFVVSATNFASRVFALDPANSETLTLHLFKPSLLRLRVIDESGSPVSGARIRLEDRYLDWMDFTDSDGRVAWNSAPNKEVEIYAHHPGFFQSRGQKYVPDGKEHALILRKELHVIGKVEDAETGEGVSRFLAIPGYPTSGDRWYGSDQVRGTNGSFSLTFTEPYESFDVRIEADGYEPLASDAIPSGVTETNLLFKIHKENAVDFIHGVVLLPDGKPAAGAEVALGTAENHMTLANACFLKRGTSLMKIADAGGRFLFKPEQWAHTIVAVHQEGFARVRLKGCRTANQIETATVGPNRRKGFARGGLCGTEGQSLRPGEHAISRWPRTRF